MSTGNESNPWVVRTDFSDNRAWEAVKRLVSAPQKDPLSELMFQANVRFVDESVFTNLSCDRVVHALPDGYPGFVVFIVDSETSKSSEHSLMVVGFSPQGDEPDSFTRRPRQTPVSEIKSFRAIPGACQAIENNLSIANMDFNDFAGAVDNDGVFRGFKS